ncbi:MAG: hypothetical protein AVDCRST_MAG30-2830 [uncultured Solirubrobacteraceae bacterium]|uniref:Uncharacterized protein n=1 Tax=uncultured Solirubrobacteraceae bacterium TaxID=1162706 RepID=A0A6J4T9U4_9ACTN|nr:MAG: hypothetical protein AVDCRST_MAG30-2830 [uncultured Solirubrobacteraceae bacterium]
MLVAVRRRVGPALGKPVDSRPDRQRDRRLLRTGPEHVRAPVGGLLLAGRDLRPVAHPRHLAAADPGGLHGDGGGEVLARPAALDDDLVVLVVAAVDVELDLRRPRAARALRVADGVAGRRGVDAPRHVADRDAVAQRAGGAGEVELERVGAPGAGDGLESPGDRPGERVERQPGERAGLRRRHQLDAVGVAAPHLEGPVDARTRLDEGHVARGRLERLRGAERPQQQRDDHDEQDLERHGRGQWTTEGSLSTGAVR